MTQNRPQTGDYAHYYEKYVALVPGGGFLEILESQLRNTSALLSPLSDSQGDFRYAPGKWSIKETRARLADHRPSRVGAILEPHPLPRSPHMPLLENGPWHLGRGFRKDLAALTEIGPDAINDNSVRQRIGPPYAPTGVWETAWLPTLN